MMSAKFSDFLTPSSPLSAFGSDLYYKINANSYYVCFSMTPPPPLMQTLYLEASLRQIRFLPLAHLRSCARMLRLIGASAVGRRSLNEF